MVVLWMMTAGLSMSALTDSQSFTPTHPLPGEPHAERPDKQRVRPVRASLERAEELALTGTWEWTLETDELSWSDNMFRLLGVEPRSITPSPAYLLERVHPDDREQVARSLESARRDGTLPHHTYRTIWSDGSVHVLQSFPAAPDRAGAGLPTRLIGAVQDVTTLCEMEQRTAASLTLVETLQAASPVGFACIDREFRFVRINETLAAAAGASAEEYIGRTVAEMAPHLWQQMEHVYRRVLESGRASLNVEVVRHVNDGQEFRVWLANCYPVQVGGEIIGVDVVVRDVTERQESESFRAAVLDTMTEGLCALDDQGRLTMMNLAASRMLGWSAEELLGKPLHDAIHFRHAGDAPCAQQTCALQSAQAGQPVHMTHDVFTRKDGTILPVAYSAAPLMKGAAAKGMVVVFRDRSHEHAAEQRARSELDSLAWVGRIRDAIDQERLVLFSQPIVPLAGGSTAKELLLRMVGPDGELIAPERFLPMAEKYGLIGEIDRWVIGQAFRIAATGQRVSANLSSASAPNLDLLPLIERELRNSGAAPSNLIFE
ncbi:MAG: PAS domain S-box protein, partial [Solirubrobacteraceae bacterium]